MLGPASVVGMGAELVVEEKEVVLVLVELVCKLGLRRMLWPVRVPCWCWGQRRWWGCAWSWWWKKKR